MTKAELVRQVATRTGVTQWQANQCIDAFVETLTEALEKDERVALPELGVFKVVERKARKGRNPKTGEEIKIPARKVVVFRPAKSLREKVK